MNNVNNSKISEFLKFLPIIIFIFNPKIDIVSFPGYWQGVRLDDLIILFYSIYFILKHNFQVYPSLINNKIFGFNWIVFFPYIVFSMMIGKYFGLSPSIILFLRYCEYIALIIILNQLDPKKDTVLLLFKLYIIINFIVVLLQYFELVGGFTSRGRCLVEPFSEHLRLYRPDFLTNCYDKDAIKSICFLNCGYEFMKNYNPAGEFILNRVPGITGGPWELAVNLSISIFALTIFEKNKKKLIPFFLIVILMMIIQQSRGVIFGFMAGSIFVLGDFKKTAKMFLIFLIFLISIYLFDIFNFKQIINKKFLLDYLQLYKIITGAFTGSLPPSSTVEGTGLESMYWRAYAWEPSLSILQKSKILLLFGAGGTFNENNVSVLYNESLIIKIITSYGLIGTFLTLYLIRKLPFFLIIFILVTGITLDLFVSFKIFIFFSIFLIIYFKNKKEIYRN